MPSDGNTTGLRQGGKFLLMAACLVVVIGGMKMSRSLLVPLFLSAFIAFLCSPPIQRLKSWGLPSWASITVVLLILVFAVLALTGIVGNSIREFTGRISSYDQSLDEMVASAITWLEDRGIDIEEENLQEIFDSRRLLTLISGILRELLGALSNLAVILLITVFMLIEAEGLPKKLRRIEGEPDADLSQYLKVSQAVNDFLRVKTGMSLLTGALVTVFLIVIGIDYPFLWGVVAFLFNYVPQIGSIIASIPAILLALITRDLATALVVAGCYVGMNTVIGNAIEPRLMGRVMGLSIFVTFVSLIFWNWVLGPVGMLLSVPLTIVVKILLEHSDDLKPAAILLGPPD